MLEIRPITLIQGCKFFLSCWEDETLVGVAVCGRPVSRCLDNGMFVKSIACHYIGVTTAIANRNYFEKLSTTKSTKASCHYIIGLQGEILRLIPEDEICWCTNVANSYTISLKPVTQTVPGSLTMQPIRPMWSCVPICTAGGDLTQVSNWLMSGAGMH